MPTTIESPPFLIPHRDRFRVERLIGTGGMGIVYQVFDRTRGERVALKLLQELSPNALFRLKREFRFLAQTRHPNLVKLYEFLHAEGAACFTMELLRGVNLLRWLHAPSVPRTGGQGGYSGNRKRLTAGAGSAAHATSSDGLGYVRRSFAQLAEGISAVHASGHLHRDIKPDNVIVTPQGRVVLLDFGLVTQGLVGNSVSLVGTPVYMAPEQLVGHVMPATDWYAFGIMLYEVLTGQLPFASEPSWVSLLRKKRDHAPVRPWELNRMVPDDLNALCLDLLDPEPSRRPGAAEIIERLAAHSDSAPVPVVASPPLFGRTRELTLVRDALAASEAGTTQLVGVFGASGMGKTAFLSEAASRAGGQALVLNGTCFETVRTPYNGIDCFMDDVVAAAKSAQGPRLVQALGLAPQLPQLFPVLGRVEIFADSVGRDQVLDRARLTDELAQLLRVVCGGRPLMICIDDAQNIDDDSLEFLMDLLASPIMPSATLVLALPQATDRFRRLAGHVQRCCGTVAEVEIGALRKAHAIACAAWLVAQHGSSLRPEKLEALVEQSAAGPRLLGELARGVIQVVDDDGESTSEVPLLTDLLSQRVQALEPGARHILEAMSIAKGPVPDAALAAVIGAPNCEAHLWDLTMDGLLTTRQGREGRQVELLNPSLQLAVSSGLSPVRIAELHLRLGRALLQVGQSAQVVAHHFSAGGQPERARGILVEAADEAMAACAWSRAARLYGRAADLGADSLETEEKRARALLASGDVPQGTRILLRLARSQPRDAALPLLHTAASALLLGGDSEAGAEVLGRILDGTGVRLPRSSLLMAPGDIVRRLALSWRLRREPVRRRPVRADARARERMEAYWTVLTTMAIPRPMLAASFHTRFILMALDHGDPEELALAYALESSFRASLGLGGARRLLARAKRLADDAGSPHAKGIVIAMEAVALLYQGEFRKCLEACGRARGHLQMMPTRSAWQLHNLLIQEVSTSFYLGDLKGLRGHVLAGRAGVEVPKTPYANAILATGFSTVALLAADQPETARRELREATRGWMQGDQYTQRFLVLVAETHRLLYEGRFAEAFTRFEAAWKRVAYKKFLAVPFVGSTLRTLRAVTAAAALPVVGKPARKVARAESRRIARSGVRWAMVLGSSARAAVAAHDGRFTDAEELLLEAERIADGCEMVLHATAARLRRATLRGETADVVAALRAFESAGAVNSRAFARLYCPELQAPRRLTE